MHPHNLLAYEDGTECFETSAYKIQMPGNYPEESLQQTEHGESLKSIMQDLSFVVDLFISITLTRSRFSLDLCRYQ